MSTFNSLKVLDDLNLNSRNFYEHSKFKLILSLIFGSFFLFCLGLLSTAASNSQHVSYEQEILQIEIDQFGKINEKNTDAYNNLQKTYDAMSHLYSGYVAASIFYFFAMIISLISSLIISPIFCGSPFESKTINTPIEIKYNDSATI